MSRHTSASIAFAVAAAAAIGIMALAGVFLYANPYGATGAETKQIVWAAFVLPNALSCAACFMRSHKLMFVLYALSLPAGLCLGLAAALPSLWSLFLPLLAVQLAACAAARKRMRAS